jgi:signal transduction histidine kinase
MRCLPRISTAKAGTATCELLSHPLATVTAITDRKEPRALDSLYLEGEHERNAKGAMSERLGVLIVDDSEADAKLIVQELGRSGRRIAHERVDRSAAFHDALERGRVDIVISEWSLPGLSALDALAAVKRMGLNIPFVVVSGSSGEEAAVLAMRTGARDFVLKDKIGLLSPIVERELGERDRRRTLQAERARAEEALRQSEIQLRYAQKMEAVGRLAGGVAHEFNNALSVILSYGELILGDLDPEDPMRADVEEMRKAARRAADLTRQLLLFSRQQVIEFKVVDLGELLGGMDQILRRLLGEDVTLSFVSAPSLGTVKGDPRSLEQVVMNLVVNARDAMPKGGKVVVETKNLDVDENFATLHPVLSPGPYVLLVVTDSGVGMDAETQARAFEPFFTTKDQGKGTGLGLSTVFGIVKQSGGTVWAASTLGEGSSICVCLPRVIASLPSRTPPPDPFSGTETILLVEDEPQVRAVARGILQKYGYEVLEARSVAEATKLCNEHAGEIHLLLSDVVTSDLTGPELAERLVPLRPQMKLLCMSGYTDEVATHRQVQASQVAYFQKPITPETLAKKVREVLDVTPAPAGKTPAST